MKTIFVLCLAMWACGASSDATGADEPESGTGGAQSIGTSSGGAGAAAVVTGGAPEADVTGGSVATGGSLASSNPRCELGKADLGCPCAATADCSAGYYCVARRPFEYKCCNNPAGDICTNSLVNG